MAADPRTFLVKNCLISNNNKVSEDSKRKEFFEGLGKIGDIEVLNRFGASKVTKGLRDLAKISDSIRTGETDSAIIPNSEGYVLDKVGINPNAAKKAGQFNPGVLNRATAQAGSILDSVKRGQYTLSDIPNTMTDLQNLSQLVDGIFTDKSGQASTRSLEICGASPYAIDLIRYAPKYKFLFVVQIELSKQYQSLSNTANRLAFVVKTSTRPQVNIDHEEVNMYNFWTRVPKRVIYEPITMRFYDDNQGLAHLFYTSYLRSISPITRLGGMDVPFLSVEWLQANSMNVNSKSAQSSASLSALEGDVKNIIREIRLFHVYDYGRKMNVYHFHHPRLLSMNLDDLGMSETGEGNEIEFQFSYDALHITPSLSIVADPSRIKSVSGESIGATYPIKPNIDPQPKDSLQEDISDEDGAPEPEQENVFKNITGAITGGIDTVTGLVSSAFDKAADFAGSIFE